MKDRHSGSQRDAEFYKGILDAMPIPVFVVDRDIRIHDLNRTASDRFHLNKDMIFRVRGGEVLHCLHSQDVPEGCGRGPHCRDCIIRNSVGRTVDGTSVSRQRMKLKTLDGDKKSELEVLITTNRLPGNEELVLLVIEDITELSTLKNIVPICMHCKRLRNDSQYWQQVEQYFEQQVGLLFSHGICPECIKEHFPTYSKD